jgi:DNA-directed RNA polymerase subunit RPC12/RpoP
MNKCSNCGNDLRITDLGVITRKIMLCPNCNTNLVVIEKPLSFFLDLLAVIVFIAIYRAIGGASYGRYWRWIIPFVLIVFLASIFVKIRTARVFIITTPNNLKAARRAERINLLILGSLVVVAAVFLLKII